MDDVYDVIVLGTGLKVLGDHLCSGGSPQLPQLDIILNYVDAIDCEIIYYFMICLDDILYPFSASLSVLLVV